MAFGRQLHQAMGTPFRKEIFFMVRNLAISHHEDVPCEISQGGFSTCEIWTLHLSPFENAFEILCFSMHAPPTSQIFLALIFSHVNSFCNLVFNRHKALSCNFAIYRGTQCLQRRYWGIDPLYINLEIYKALFFSLFLFFPISIFLVAKQPLRAFPQRIIG